MNHQIHSEINIDAPADVVWAILTDLDAYADWNPFVIASSGTTAVGEKLTNRMQNPGGRAMTIRPEVTVVEPDETFEWLGHLGMPGIFDARHRFEIETTATGVAFHQSEDFKGVLVRVMRRSLDSQTVHGFEEMNEALKARAEARVGNNS